MEPPTWIAIGRDGSGARGFSFAGDTLTGEAHAANETHLLEKLGANGAPLIRIGDGPASIVPCAVLPEAGRGLPVITQTQPADVMGGWARLWIAGYLARYQDWDGVLCVTDGDISHWVHLSAGEVVSFASFLTLRLISFLDGAASPDPQAMADSQSRPERLAQYLRQAEVAGDRRALTGHLIGAELAASRVYWLGQQVGVIAPEGDGSPHASALAVQNVPLTIHTPEDLIPEGLIALGRKLGLAG